MSDSAPTGTSQPTPPGPPGNTGAGEPAQALAEVWELLDALPDVTASPAMLATTIEMAALPPPRPAPVAAVTRAWIAVPVVLGALLLGMVAGRSMAPHPDVGTLTHLPCVRHLDLLREAGSVAFLEELARRDYQPPRRLPPAQLPAEARADAEEFAAAVESFRGMSSGGQNKDLLAERRQQVLDMPDGERRQLDASVEKFQRLPPSERRELVVLARTLADPSQSRLVEAARMWHQWVQLRDPADRRDVIELSTPERLEWIERMTRLASRLENRELPRGFFDRDTRRRPPGPGQQPPAGAEFGPQRPGAMAPGGPTRPWGPSGPGGFGGGQRAAEGDDRERPPVTPAPPQPPAENPLAPR